MLRTLIATAVLATAVAAASAAPAISRTTLNDLPVSGSPQRDDAFGSDMRVVHEMLADHDKIKRSVTNLPNGIRTVTESDDQAVAKEIKDHVASMDRRLKDGRVFNVASHTLPTIFANSDKINTDIRQTATGVILTQTSNDPATVAALQGHAREVSVLAHGGMVAMMRSVMANGGPMGAGMGMMGERGGPMGDMRGGTAPMGPGEGHALIPDAPVP